MNDTLVNLIFIITIMSGYFYFNHLFKNNSNKIPNLITKKLKFFLISVISFFFIFFEFIFKI